MLSRHSEGASRRERVSMYPWIKVVRTQDKKGNAAWENIPKLATRLHPNLTWDCRRALPQTSLLRLIIAHLRQSSFSPCGAARCSL